MTDNDHNNYIQSLNQAGAEASKSFYKTLLSLSTGALGLSLTFLSKDYKGQAPRLLYFLFASWALFILCLIMMLCSYFLITKALEWQFAEADRYYNEKEQDNYPDPKNNPSNVHLIRLYRCAATLFILGAVCTAIFIGGCMYGQKAQSKKSQGEEATPQNQKSAQD